MTGSRAGVWRGVQINKRLRDRYQAAIVLLVQSEAGLLVMRGEGGMGVKGQEGLEFGKAQTVEGALLGLTEGCHGWYVV